jgi:hypothetical protein
MQESSTPVFCRGVPDLPSIVRNRARPSNLDPLPLLPTGVIEQYTRFVKPAFDQFIGPSRRHADLIIPWQGSLNNIVAIDLITGGQAHVMSGRHEYCTCGSTHAPHMLFFHGPH